MPLSWLRIDSDFFPKFKFQITNVKLTMPRRSVPSIGNIEIAKYVNFQVFIFYLFFGVFMGKTDTKLEFFH